MSTFTTRNAQFTQNLPKNDGGVYITDYNLKRLLREITVEKLLPEDKDILFYVDCNLDKLLSIPEMKNLIACNHLFGNSTKLELVCRIVTTDSRTKVIAESMPAYHVDPSCSFAKGNYLNFTIPHAVRKLGETAVQDFRQMFPIKEMRQKAEWALQNPNDFRTTEDIIKDRMEEERRKNSFNLHAFIDKYRDDLNPEILLDQIVGGVYYGKNSGIKDVYQSIAEKFQDAQVELQAASAKLKRFFDDLEQNILHNPGDKAVFHARWLGEKDLKYAFQKHPDELRSRIDRLIELKQEYIWRFIYCLQLKHSFNQEKLNQGFLDSMGFKMCAECQKKRPDLVRFDLSFLND